MIVWTVKSGHFLAEREKLKKYESVMFGSALDFIDAALWLIGGDRIPQALVMLHNAIEVALKGELERIHRLLIVDHRRLKSFDALKSLLGDAFAAHPRGRDIEVLDFDFERTIYFAEAFGRIAEIYPELSSWKDRLVASGPRPTSLHAMRNNIVHAGGDSATQYVSGIVEVALPFLGDFFSAVTERAVSMELLLMEWIYREVEVARAVLSDLRDAKLPEEGYAIKTLQHHILWTFAGWPNPTDDLASIELSGETGWEGYASRQSQELWRKWDNFLSVEITCPVCESSTGDGSRVQAQVLLEEDAIENNEFVAEGFNCFVCGLHISPKQRFLARHFVGEIPEEIQRKYLKDRA